MRTIHSGRGGSSNAILFTIESDSLPVTDSSKAHTYLEGTWLQELTPVVSEEREVQTGK